MVTFSWLTLVLLTVCGDDLHQMVVHHSLPMVFEPLQNQRATALRVEDIATNRIVRKLVCVAPVPETVYHDTRLVLVVFAAEMRVVEACQFERGEELLQFHDGFHDQQQAN